MAIKIISLNKLPNAFHFETVMKTLERIGATSVAQENVGVRPLFEDLQAKFQREDAAYRQSLKSFKTDEIKQLDDEPQEERRRGRGAGGGEAGNGGRWGGGVTATAHNDITNGRPGWQRCELPARIVFGVHGEHFAREMGRGGDINQEKRMENVHFDSDFLFVMTK